MDKDKIILNLNCTEKKTDVENTRAIDALKNCMEMLLESRDRVDISLREYENLKKCIKKLSAENDRMKNIFDQLGFDLVKCDCGLDVIDHVVPGSIRTIVKDPCDDFLLTNRRIIIEFDVKE